MCRYPLYFKKITEVDGKYKCDLCDVDGWDVKTKCHGNISNHMTSKHPETVPKSSTTKIKKYCQLEEQKHDDNKMPDASKNFVNLMIVCLKQVSTTSSSMNNSALWTSFNQMKSRIPNFGLFGFAKNEKTPDLSTKYVRKMYMKLRTKFRELNKQLVKNHYYSLMLDIWTRENTGKSLLGVRIRYCEADETKISTDEDTSSKKSDAKTAKTGNRNQTHECFGGLLEVSDHQSGTIIEALRKEGLITEYCCAAFSDNTSAMQVVSREFGKGILIEVNNNKNTDSQLTLDCDEVNEEFQELQTDSEDDEGYELDSDSEYFTDSDNDEKDDEVEDKTDEEVEEITESEAKLFMAEILNMKPGSKCTLKVPNLGCVIHASALIGADLQCVHMHRFHLCLGQNTVRS